MFLKSVQNDLKMEPKTVPETPPKTSSKNQAKVNQKASNKSRPKGFPKWPQKRLYNHQKRFRWPFFPRQKNDEFGSWFFAFFGIGKRHSFTKTDNFSGPLGEGKNPVAASNFLGKQEWTKTWKRIESMKGLAECAELLGGLSGVKIKHELSFQSSTSQLPCKQGAGGL